MVVCKHRWAVDDYCKDCDLSAEAYVFARDFVKRFTEWMNGR